MKREKNTEMESMKRRGNMMARWIYSRKRLIVKTKENSQPLLRKDTVEKFLTPFQNGVS